LSTICLDFEIGHIYIGHRDKKGQGCRIDDTVTLPNELEIC